MTESNKEELFQNGGDKNPEGVFGSVVPRIRKHILRAFGGKNEIKELYGNKEKILKNLKENYVNVEKNVEMMGYKGKKVHINLPKLGKFKGFTFDYFVSDVLVRKDDFESNPELEKKSYSMKEVGNLLKAINNYMNAMGVEIDRDVDYENDLKGWEAYTRTGEWSYHKSVAGDCFNNIAGLDGWYWLKDKNVAGEQGSRAHWHEHFDYSEIIPSYYCDLYKAHLFLKLS